MNNYCEDFTEEVQELFKSEHNPELIRNEFGNTGSDYGLVTGRNVPVTISCFLYNEETQTYSLSGTGWQFLSLTFDDDLDTTTNVKASYDISLVDEGEFDQEYIPGSGQTVLPNINTSERYQGIFPESEIEKLEGLDWVVAEIMTPNRELLSRCVFKVLGGQ